MPGGKGVMEVKTVRLDMLGDGVFVLWLRLILEMTVVVLSFVRRGILLL